MTTRGLRRFKSANKYISRIKKYFSKFPNFHRVKRKAKPSTWKEMSEDKSVKHFKDTPTTFTSEWDAINHHRRLKSDRMETRHQMRDIVNNNKSEEDEEQF